MVPLMKWQAIASMGAAVLLLFVVLTRFHSDRRTALAGQTAN
jgi:hypothetical protein